MGWQTQVHSAKPTWSLAKCLVRLSLSLSLYLFLVWRNEKRKIKEQDSTFSLHSIPFLFSGPPPNRKLHKLQIFNTKISTQPRKHSKIQILTMIRTICPCLRNFQFHKPKKSHSFKATLEKFRRPPSQQKQCRKRADRRKLRS